MNAQIKNDIYFKTLAAATSDIIYRMSPDWKYMNFLKGKSFLTDTRKPSDNWIKTYIPQKEQKRVLKFINEAIRTKSAFQLEHQVYTKNNNIGWTLSRAFPIKNEKGEITEWLGAATDITKRKKYDCDLDQGIFLVRGIIENSTDLIAAIDINFNFLAMNETYQKECQAIYGIDVKIGDNLLDMVASNPEDRKNLISLFAPVFQGKTIVTTQAYGDPNKSRRIYELTVNPIFDSQKHIIGAAHINREITKRYETEEALKKSEERYRSLFENITENFQIVEPILNKEGRVIDFRYIKINKATEALIGKKRHEIEGKKSHEVWNYIEDYWFETLEKVLNTDKRIHMIGNSKNLDRYFDFIAWRASGNNVALLYSDVTKQKKAEEDLRRSEERANLLIKHAPSMLYEIDLNTLKIISVNDNICQTLGYTKKELLKLSALDLLTPESQKAFQEIIKSSLAERISPKTMEYTVKKKDGSLIIVIINISYTSKNGKPENAIIAAHDITENKQLEQKKDDFIGIASHELKTPLTSIKLYSGTLMKNLENTEVIKKIFPRINAQIDILVSLVNELLDVSSIQANKLKLNKENFSLQDLISDLVQTYKITSPDYRINLINNSEGEIFADKERIRQVLTNLISNAIKYSGNKKQIKINLKNNHEFIEVSIKDYGIGIEKQFKDKIFDRFFRSDKEGISQTPGLGMGLYISNEIIKQHKGKIWVNSRVGKGSIFHFILPLN